MKAIMNDEVMERLIDTLMELQKKESTDLPLLKKQLAETENSFVNAVYLYEDKVILTFNYKDGSKTITLAEVEGSDLSVLGAGLKTSVKNEFDIVYGGFCFIPSLSLYQTLG